MGSLRLTTYLDEHKILSDFQFGFRKKQSTEDPLILFLYNITESSERKECAIAIIFSDSQKAFDTCDPKNLCHMDRTGLVQQLQYFTNRRQLVSIENETSARRLVTCGVIPQGSIYLVPFCF